MQKILNDPLAFVDEMLEGVVLAHADQLRLVGEERLSTSLVCSLHIPANTT
jgi:hypothetical protein